MPVSYTHLDNGARQFLNFGHTFGHAVEKSMNFTLSHGQCVAIGMVMAFRAAGLDDTEIIRALIACSLPTASPCSLDALCAAALLDKKRRGGMVTLVPVSYTHLDVYKRQSKTQPARPANMPLPLL